MKILIAITYYAPNISGLTIYAKRLAEGLVKKGHQVTVLTSRHKTSLPKREIINGVEVKRSFVLLKIGKGVIMPFLPLEALTLVRKSDVINCHLPQPEAFWFLLLARIFNKKTVVTYHCDVKLPSSLGNLLTEKTLLISNFLSCFLSEKIVSSSLDYAKNSSILRFFLKKLKIVYPPIKDFSQIKENNNLREKISTYKKKYKIGFAGRLAADKGVEHLFLSIPFLKKKLTSFGIFLIGPKKPIGEKVYQNKISKLSQKYKKTIFLLGKLSEQELGTFFKSIDALILPSINSTEAFGMVQVEAMVCGVPIVATNLPGVRVPIKLTGMGKSVAIKDHQEIAKAIIDVLENKKDYLKPKREIKKTFSFQKTIDSYEKLFF